jgi:hypothetical protein
MSDRHGIILSSARNAEKENRMYTSIARLNEAEKLGFDPSTLNFDYNQRNVDDYDTFRVEKGMVVMFADKNNTDPVDMFNKLVESANGIGDAEELYQQFTDFCLEVD